MKGMPVLLAGVAIVTIILLGFGSSSDNSHSIDGVDFTPPTNEPTYVRHIVPETLSASQTTGTVDSQDFEASDIQISQKYDMPDLLPEADARIAEEITINRWTFNDVEGYTTFDSAGNIFTHDNYRVARIDTANNTQTTWTAPDGWNLHGRGSISTSGHYYFIANGNLTSLDPDTGVFTQWNIGVGGSIYAVGDSVYFDPKSNRILAENHSEYFDVTYIHSDGRHFEVYGVGAVGSVDIEILSPLNMTYNNDDVSYDSEFYQNFRIFSNRGTLSDDETGTYTVRATNQNKTVEKTFEMTKLPFEFGELVVPPYIFLQKLTPDDATVTSYHMDSLQRHDFDLMIDSLDGSMYFQDEYVYRNNDIRGIMKFEPNTLDITHWSDLHSYRIFPIGTSYNGDNIYWGYNAGRNTVKLVSLDTHDGILTETASPEKCNERVRYIAVDSLDNVFFNSCSFYKYVPSTNTFTSFGGINFYNLKIDRSDMMYWNDYRNAGTVTFATRIVPIEIQSIEIDTPTTIRIQTDSILTGNPQANDFTVSNNTVSRVDLKSSDVVVTVGTPIMPGNNDVTISYSGSSIGDGTAQLESFTNRDTDDNIEPNILDIDILSSTQIRITTDNDLVWDDGDYNQRTDLFTVSDNTVEDVEIQDKIILITVGTPILHGDTVMVSYTNYGAIENLGSRSLEPFTDIQVTNNIDPQVQVDN